MRIGINACPLRISGGGARYVFTELLDQLLQINERHEYVVFTQFEGLRILSQIPRVHAHLFPNRPVRTPVRLLEVAREEDILNYRDEFDLFFGPLNNLQPRVYDRPSVAVLHDIQEQYFPQFFSEADLLARREIYPEICHSSTLLVTISEFCKQTFVDKFQVDPDKIRVVYNAPQAGLVQRAREDHGHWPREALPADYLLYTANCYQHKNHALLLDALRLLKREGLTPPMVFVGFELPGGFPLAEEIRTRGLSEQCRVFSQVRVEELRHLYCKARALVMPTLFEGFGVPAIEAMACGCPVICSNVPALREICGEHALYFDPQHSATLADVLRGVLREPQRLTRLREAGYGIAAEFTWERAARQMLAIFDEAAQRFFELDPADRDAAVQLPRIGVAIQAVHGGWGVPESIKNLLELGYPNTAMLVQLPEGQRDENLLRFLLTAGVTHEVLSASQIGTWSPLARFAEQQQLDLVGATLAGHNRLTATALHSVGYAYRREPGKAAYLGEAWEVSPSGITDSARLRRLGDGLWKLQGFIYPEMLFVRPAALTAESRRMMGEAGREWRWELVKELHRSGRLALLRRTLGICNAASVSLMARYRAGRAGVEVVQGLNGQHAPAGWLTSFQPVLRPMSRLLPDPLREKGKRVWRHLTQG